jgi:S1-C subfamily serine protease
MLMVATASAALSAEGFFTDNRPPSVRAAWGSVYAFVCEGRGDNYTATAFLVGRGARGEQTDYFFITAGHAIEDCRQPRRYLVDDINRPRFESDGITLAARPQRLSDIALVYVDDAYDLAVIKVAARATLHAAAPISVGDACDRALHQEIYAIGFPGVGKRRSLRLAQEMKRWSKGEFVGFGKAEFQGTQSVYIAASVDSLPGNSGGPVIDAQGALVGVVVKGAAAPENGFRYDVDPKKKGDWHSFLVPCQAVVRIMQRSGLRPTN